MNFPFYIFHFPPVVPLSARSVNFFEGLTEIIILDFIVSVVRQARGGSESYFEQ